jgi:hypothetical protein
MRQFDAKYIENELEEIGRRIKKPVDIYLIGGCAMSFRGLKETTKDVDIVFTQRGAYEAFCYALFGAQYFEPGPKIIDEYGHLQAAKMMENKDGFHLDLFIQTVCGKMQLSEPMMKRAEFYRKYDSMSVYLVAKEDIFLFKSLASESRTRDLDDMRSIYPNLDWKAMETELISQHLGSGLVEHAIKRFEAFQKAYDLDVPILDRLKKNSDRSKKKTG